MACEGQGLFHVAGDLWLNDACFVSCLFQTIPRSGVFMLTYFIISNLHFHHQGTALSGPIACEESLVDDTILVNVQYL